MKIKTSIFFLILSLYLLANFALAQTAPPSPSAKQKIIYEYKKKEFIDLGNLDIKGTLLAPGDISVQNRKRKEFDRNLFNRDDFNDKCTEDILNLR